MQYYPILCKIAHDIIAEGFSTKVITPGVTTTDDIVWWYRERIRDLNLVTWFHPSVDIQRNDNQNFDFLSSFSSPIESQLENETRHIVGTMDTHDGPHGLNAFFNKEKPRFTGS